MKIALGVSIVFVLLGLYVYSVVIAILVVNCVSSSGCSSYPLSRFTDGMLQALTLVGGLVSALVIAELAITKRGEMPMARLVDPKASNWISVPAKLAIVIYLVAWLAVGLSAFWFGMIQHPKVLQPLTDLGQSWLGLAVAATYAYFGINPQGP
jgi:hypothetical protein